MWIVRFSITDRPDAVRRSRAGGCSTANLRRTKKIAFESPNEGGVRLAQPNSRFDQRVEHRLQVERRAADNLEHFAGGSLSLQSLLEFHFQFGVGLADAANASLRFRFAQTSLATMQSVLYLFWGQGSPRNPDGPQAGF
jgi:hypothetical protein